MDKTFIPYVISTLINILMLIAAYNMIDGIAHNAEGRLSSLEGLPTNRREQLEALRRINQQLTLSADEHQLLSEILEELDH